MAPLEIACVATLLLLGSVLANHNDLDIVSIYDSNLYYDVRNIGYSTALVNDTYTSATAYGGCAIETMSIDPDMGSRVSSDILCVGQWMVDGNYQPIFDFYGKDYADNTDDDADSVSDPGPMFTATNGPLDYYTYYPGYYDNDIAIHTAVIVHDDGTAVMYSGFRNLGPVARTITVNAGPEQEKDTNYASGNGWNFGNETDIITITSDGDSFVENSDTFIQVTSRDLLVTTSNRGTVDSTNTQQAVYYSTTNDDNGILGPSRALEMEVTHTISLQPGEIKALLTFIQICNPDFAASCMTRSNKLLDEEAIFNAGYVNWLGPTQLSQVVNYDAVHLATGVAGGDPHMTPLTGIRRTEDIHGAHGAMINLISDSDLVMNMRLKELAAFKALGAEATYIEALALQFEAGDQLLLTVEDGLGYELTLNGEALAIGDNVAVAGARIMVQAVPQGKTFQGWFNARYRGHNLQAMVHVVTDNYNIELYPVYKDSFTNWHSGSPGDHTLLETHSFLDMDVSLLKSTGEARGVLGETAHPSVERDTQTLDQRVEHYAVSSLFDTNFQ